MMIGLLGERHAGSVVCVHGDKLAAVAELLEILLVPTRHRGAGAAGRWDGAVFVPWRASVGRVEDWGMGEQPSSVRRAGLAIRLGAVVCLLIGALVVAERGRDQGVVVAAPSDTSVFTPMKPQRLVDTRIGLGTPQRRLRARTSVNIQVTRRLGIPSNATAVVANVIAVDADRPGYLQLLPTGQAAFGSSSTLNVDTPGQTIPNAAFAPLGNKGKLTVYAIFTADVVIDIFGYFTPATSSKAGRLVPLTPTRILDTRISLGWTPPTPLGNLAVRFGESVVAETTVTLKVAGRGGVPKSGVSAVVMNVTAVDPAGPGYVQVAPTPVVRRATSNLNTAAGRTIANLVVVPLGTAGSIDLFVTTQADLVADVVGYFTDNTAPASSKGLFVPITPNRQLDTRLPAPRKPRPEGTVTTIDINDISTTAIAIAGNLTATEATQPGYLQLAAPPISVRTSSNLNISYAGQTIANAVVSPVAADKVQLYNRYPTHELLDVTGWFTSVAAQLPPTTTTTTKPTPTTTAPSTTTTTTVPSPPVARLAYAWQNQIYTINPDGTGQLELTSGDKNYWPRWSPDGNRIAYVHEVAGAHSLWVMNANGSNKQQITDEINSFGAAWSPDGGWLAFGGASGAFPDGELKRVRSTAPFGNPQAFLSWEENPGDLRDETLFPGGTPAWSPSSNEIYFYGGDLTGIYDEAILAYDVATQRLWMLTAIGGGGSYGSVAEPAISPDGTRLGYTLTRSPPSVPEELGPLISLRSYPSMTSIAFTTFAEDAQLAFSRTDTRVALMNDSTGTAQVIVADADGTNRQYVTNGYQPDWQPQP